MKNECYRYRAVGYEFRQAYFNHDPRENGACTQFLMIPKGARVNPLYNAGIEASSSVEGDAV